MAKVEIDASEFLAGLHEALHDFDGDAEQIVDEVGDKVVELAQAYAPKRTGKLTGSIGAEPGRDEKGPYVEVGTSDPVGFYQEFG